MTNPIDVVQLIDDDEQYSPPSKVLRLSQVEDTVFLSICSYKETHVTTTTEVIAHFSVDIHALLAALAVLNA